jgi:hypothetical protein
MVRGLSKFRGRSAHVSRSANDDRYWDSNFEAILQLPSGQKTTITNYFNNGGAEKLGHGTYYNQSYSRRRCHIDGCDMKEIQVDGRGFAYCPHCNNVYNDGNPPKMPKLSSQIIKASAVQQQNRKASRKRSLKALCKS